MRGKVDARDVFFHFFRITPAYAGKSHVFPCSHALKKDHPRLCGEKIQLPFCFFWYGGSPPPMRGKVIVPTSAGTNRRITPAYAGKSIKKSKTYLLRWDHPRLCGEKRQPQRFSEYCKGSPPPMRGKGKARHNRGTDFGITPAYAGKSPIFILERAFF